MKLDYENRTVTYRQSWLSNYFDCPEKARRGLLEPDADTSTDAAILGTGLHAYAECRLLGEDRAASMAAALNALDIEFGQPHRIVQKSEVQVYDWLPSQCAAWERDILPQVGEVVAVEHNFNLSLGYIYDDAIDMEPDFVPWEIRLSGQIDCVTTDTVWDWKTWGREKPAWEQQRWAVQPTVYSFAATREFGFTYPVNFKFGAIIKAKANPKPQIIPVTRTDLHEQWLFDQLRGITRQALKLGFEDEWTKRDQSALCSADWCVFWDTCKGKYL